MWSTSSCHDRGTRFFEVLEDTLVVNRLDAYAADDTRRLVRHAKFYFFDSGVLNGLLRNFSASEDRRGALFEHFIVNQILSASSDLSGLKRFATRLPKRRFRAMVIYTGSRAYRDEIVDVLPWRRGLSEIRSLLS